MERSMDVFSALRTIVKADMARRQMKRDCHACYAAFALEPVAGRWVLGFERPDVQYHWLANDRVESMTERMEGVAEAVCGAEVYCGK